jgi:hypothetical protein
VASYLKQLSYRAARRAGLVETPPRRAYLTNLRIDAASPTGSSAIPNGPVLTEFSRKDFKLERNASGQVSIVQVAGAV